MRNHLCEPKRESIRSSVVGIYFVVRELLKKEKIPEKEATLILSYLSKIEKCNNLSATVEALKNTEKELRGEG